MKTLPQFLLFFTLILITSRARSQSISRISHLGNSFTIIRLSPADLPRLRLYLKDPSNNQLYQGFDALEASLNRQKQSLVFAMNGGMYHPDFSPVGLFVENGRTLTPLNNEDRKGNFFLKPNGVFSWNENGARVLESSAYLKDHQDQLWATQSGPMLVINGKIHPAFKPLSTSRLQRNGVGVSEKGDILFCISDEPVNFHEMASLFQTELACYNALFLDGVISSLFSQELKRNDKSYGLGPIIALTAEAVK